MKAEILKNFPNAEFDNHYSDLYVKVIPGLMSWLWEKYQFVCNITLFRYNGELWVDIPFANDDFWT